MEFNHRKRYASMGPDAAPSAPVPGKQTLTQGMVQMHPVAPPSSAPAASSPPLPVPAGPRPTLQMLFGRRDAAPGPEQVHAAAARGTATAAAQLPHLEQIQRSFGRHDVSGVQAHVGAEAAASAQEMGAAAYATGNHVVLGAGTDLHTVAHEAAHVVQQRAGVHLKGGVGEVEDTYERQADEVADRVVSGHSAEDLLDAQTGAASGAPASATPGSVQPRAAPIDAQIQRKLRLRGLGEYEDGSALENALDSNPKLKDLAVEPFRSQAIAIAQAKALYDFGSAAAMVKALKAWTSPDRDLVPRELNDYIVGYLEKEVDPQIEERKKELRDGIESVGKPWNVCGMTARQIITALRQLDADIAEDGELTFSGDSGREALAQLMTAKVAKTTLLDCWIDGIHEWTLDQEPGLGTILSQGFLGTYSAFWWAGLDPKGPNDDVALSRMRDTFGKGQIIDVEEFVSKVGEFQHVDKWSNEARIGAWEQLPMSPRYSAPKTRNEGEPILVKVVRRVVNNSDEVFGKLGSQPGEAFLSQLVIAADWAKLSAQRQELEKLDQVD